MLLLLVRHGDTALTSKQLVGRTPGVHLDDRGRAQAAGLPARLEGLPVTSIISSPLDRAVETATPLAEARGLEVTQEAGLLEVDYGDWTGKAYKELRRTDLWKRVQVLPADARFPGGEAMREAQARIAGALERICAASPGTEGVVAVSHSDMIKAAVAHLLGLHLDLFQRLVVSPASVTALWVGEGQPRLLRLNDTGTMQDLRPPRRRRGGRRGAEN